MTVVVPTHSLCLQTIQKRSKRQMPTHTHTQSILCIQKCACSPLKSARNPQTTRCVL